MVIGIDYTDRHWVTNRMVEALAARAAGVEPPEAARPFFHMGYSDLAYNALVGVGRDKGLTSKDRVDCITLGLVQSDLKLLTADLMGKTLLYAYRDARPSFRELATERVFDSFRPHHFIRAGDFPAPLEVGEHGSFQHGYVSDSGELISLATYGRILGISLQTLINDDLGALTDISRLAALRLADLENMVFFVKCITSGSGLGPDLSDSKAVYHTDHSNITGAGALDVTLLGSARALLKSQITPDGLRLNTPAKVLLVSPASETAAEELLATLAPGQSDASMMRVIGDSNLTGTRFYVLADPDATPQYVYGSLRGDDGPSVQSRSAFDFDGIRVRVRRDFAVGAIDYRGGVTGAGS